MEHIHPIFDQIVSRSEKEQLLNQSGKVFWLTGLSGSGKSTIGKVVERKLYEAGYLVQLLDGDNIRTGICNNLGFTLEDRKENIRRISEVSRLFVNAGIICINCFVSPTIQIRNLSREIIGEDDFFEIYINTTLQECETRDVKGLYAKARAGEIKNFTGIDSPYEAPENPALTIKTEEKTIEQSADMLLRFIKENV